MITMWAEHNTRKPILSLRLSGALLLRAAERALAGLLFQDPPRTTRATSQGTPQAETCPPSMAARCRKGKKIASAATRRSVFRISALQ
jgi:hypothetical protein